MIMAFVTPAALKSASVVWKPAQQQLCVLTVKRSMKSKRSKSAANSSLLYANTADIGTPVVLAIIALTNALTLLMTKAVNKALSVVINKREPQGSLLRLSLSPCPHYLPCHP